MFLELIATIFAGIAVAGIVILINKTTGGRLPGWVTPAAAGLGMIAATIASEYSWFKRNSANLPDGVVVIETVENRSFYRPWTQLFPYVQRFVALDQGQMRSHESHPDHLVADLYFFGRWSRVTVASVVLDCQNWQHALITPKTEFNADGSIKDPQWISAQTNDPILSKGCEEM